MCCDGYETGRREKRIKHEMRFCEALFRDKPGRHSACTMVCVSGSLLLVLCSCCQTDRDWPDTTLV